MQSDFEVSGDGSVYHQRQTDRAVIERPLGAKTQAEALATGWRPRSMGDFYWFCHLGRGLPREALYHLCAGCGGYLEAPALVREELALAFCGPCAEMERAAE